MFSLKFITNLFVLTLLFVSCFGQKNSVEQEQSTTFDSINDQRDFYMIIAAQQKDFFQYDNYFYYKFHNKHKKMNLIDPPPRWERSSARSRPRSRRVH